MLTVRKARNNLGQDTADENDSFLPSTAFRSKGKEVFTLPNILLLLSGKAFIAVFLNTGTVKKGC